MKDEMNQHDTARDIALSYRFLMVVAAVAIVAAIGMPVWYLAIRSTSTTTTTLPAVTGTIHLAYPSDWMAVSAKNLSGVPSNATFVLQQKDKLGILIVLPGGKAPALDSASVATLSAELAKQYADYKFLGANMVSLKSEKALLLSYLRTKQGVLHEVMIIPVGHKSFYIETASPPSNVFLGTEIGMILASATVSSKS